MRRKHTNTRHNAACLGQALVESRVYRMTAMAELEPGLGQHKAQGCNASASGAGVHHYNHNSLCGGADRRDRILLDAWQGGLYWKNNLRKGAASYKVQRGTQLRSWAVSAAGSQGSVQVLNANHEIKSHSNYLLFL